MNILILNWRDVRHPKSGGAEIVTMEHAKGWVSAGHTVTWLTAHYDGAKKDELYKGIQILRRAGPWTIYFFVPIFLIRHRHKFDVIVDEAHGFPFFTPLFTHTPVIIFIHEIAGEIWDYMFSFPKNYIGKTLENLYFYLYHNCMFWTDAQSTVDELSLRGIPKSQCTAIPCPIIERRTPGGSRGKEKDPTFIFVSRVVRMKGIEEVIKAFSFIYRVRPDAKLWIVGGGETTYVAELKRMIQEYGVSKQVAFFGRVSDNTKFMLMSRAYLLLHASVKEGWGLVVLEAASVGTPSVVYNVSGLKDVVKDGRTGIVIHDNSPQRMAKESLEILKDHHRYSWLQKNGYSWVKSLTWPSAIGSSLRLLNEATARHT